MSQNVLFGVIGLKKLIGSLLGVREKERRRRSDIRNRQYAAACVKYS